MNKAILIGNLTRDPEHSTVGTGVSLCKFSIAINRPFANAEGVKEVDYLNIITWRGLADNCSKYLTKGSKVAVVGTIQTRTYEGTDGVKKYATDIVADEVEFVSLKNSSNSDDSTETSYAKSTSSAKKAPVEKLEPVSDDGLPF